MKLSDLFSNQHALSKKALLTYQKLQSIGDIPSQYHRIQILHLSNNLIESLQGIQVFQNLTTLSIQNNLIQNIQEFECLNENVMFLNVSGNPFIQNTYQYHEYFYQKFKSLKRLDGHVVDPNQNLYLTTLSDVLSRWFIYLIIIIEKWSTQIQQIYQKKKITLEFQTQQENYTFEKDQSLKSINWEQIYIFINYQQLYGSTILHKQITLNTLLINLQYITQIIKQFIHESLIPDKQFLILYKQTFHQAFRDIITHQASQNIHSFIDFLIKKNPKEQDHFKTFLQLQPSQAHISQDFIVYEKIYKVEEKKIIQQIPIHLQDKINKGLLLQTINSRPYQQPQHQKHYFQQYFPVYPYRLEYMHSMFFIISNKIMTLQNSIDELISIGNYVIEYPREQCPSPIKQQTRRKKQGRQKEIRTDEENYQNLETCKTGPEILIENKSINQTQETCILQD